MKKYETLAFGVALCFSLNCKDDYPQPQLKDYSSKITYQNFSEINFNNIPPEKIPLPKDLRDGLSKPRVKNKKLLEELIRKQVRKLGIDKEQMKNLPPKKALQLSMDVAASSLAPHDVDHDKKFITSHGAHLPIEKCIEIGQGDCDKYTNVAITAFRFFKEENHSLQNIYISDSNLGGNRLDHDWNVVIILKKGEIIISHLDPTFYDVKNELEAKRGYHIPNDDNELLARLFRDIGDYETSYNFYEKAFNKSVGCTEERAKTLSDMMFAAYNVGDRKKVEKVRKLHDDLDTLIEQDDILYFSYVFEKNNGNAKKAEEFKNKLKTGFPNSIWVKEVI